LRLSISGTVQRLLGVLIVKTFMKQAAVAAAFGTAFVSGTILSAQAGASDYEFQLVSKELKADVPAEIVVRLVHKPDGKPVPDAVIFATRLDMGPDSMEEMTTPVTAVPGGAPGIYRFRAKLSMAGGWAFSLGAKVQGETDTVQGKLLIKAMP
jgi:YtkA-like